MGARNLQQCIRDLESAGKLVCVDEPLEAGLEIAEVQRRVFASAGPALLFKNVRGCQFPVLGNLFGEVERARYLFRDTWDRVRRLIELNVAPARCVRHPWRYAGCAWTAWTALPRSCRSGPVLARKTRVSELPQLKSWPEDGGAFITLPLVYTEEPNNPGLLHSNLGMYRVQLSGNQYDRDREVGLHYQLHRSIGVHHAAAIRRGESFPVNIFVGGAPAMTLAAIMPLPEGLSELTFAGALAGHRIPMIRRPGRLPIYAQADFCITGTVLPETTKLEGPFGDHLGYYSLAHPFPVLRVEQVYHREGAVWPFTVVGRPPQEDTIFGQLIHELTGPVVPTVIPGVHQVHAVDAAGVHPLLLAVGSERYTPYEKLTRPQELLTQALAILGRGPLSLAKYLWIAACNDAPDLKASDVADFFQHVLRRVDWRRDIHFLTETTIDTLDYSGTGLNRGSKAIIAAAGPPIRELPHQLPANLTLPEGFVEPQVAMPGVLVIQGPAFAEVPDAVDAFCRHFNQHHTINRFPLLVIADDSRFTVRAQNNFLWVTFTRSNPASDVYGIASSTSQKHWGCGGSLVIDARTKPHHAPPLIEDPDVSKKIDALAARGGPLARYL